MTSYSEKISKGAKIRSTNVPEIVFVIMSFSGNPIIKSYYDEAILPTIQKYGLKCVRVDEEAFTGEISKRIIDNIKRARIVLVDLTEDRPNCYFEAGYALALNKPVIFQRLNAPHYEAKFEFDVKDFNHILYGTIAELREKLSKVLEAELE